MSGVFSVSLSFFLGFMDRGELMGECHVLVSTEGLKG